MDSTDNTRTLTLEILDPPRISTRLIACAGLAFSMLGVACSVIAIKMLISAN